MDHNNENSAIDLFKQLNIDLSEDEQKILDKLNEKLLEKLEERKKYVVDHADEIMKDPNLLKDDPIHSRHITDYNREILTTVRMEISSTNDEGVLTELGQILEGYYHIPVPSGCDYTQALDKFMTKFDNTLEDFAKKIHENEPRK